MIIVKIEMWPGGKGGSRVREIGRMVIYNEGGTQTATRGNYVARLMRRSSADQMLREELVEALDSKELFDRFEITDGPVQISEYPRLAYSAWALVSRCIKALKIEGG